MSDEPKPEAAEASTDEKKLSTTKSLTLQPSAEFVAEQESTTGPQISLPSSPAGAADAAPTPPPETPVAPDPEYTPAPDPLAQQMQAQSVPVEKPRPETPLAQPVVPEAFQAPEQTATKAHHTPPAQQFVLTSEAAAAEKEANAMTSLLEGGTLAAGFAAMLVYSPGGYWIRNEWVIAGISTILVAVSVACAVLRYRAKNNLGVASTIGLAAATFSILTLVQFIIIEVFLRNMGGSGSLF